MAWNAIIGQESIKQIWQAQWTSGKLTSAYLLAGPDGVGKKRLALEMAKAMNCSTEDAAPCDSCSFCQQINRSVHPDVHLLSPGGEAKMIRIADIRQLLSRVSLRPYSAKMQVVIIDQVERLTEESANALLKTLEEPPAQVRFLLTTSLLSQCLPTIVSRAQLLRAQALDTSILKRLLEAHESFKDAKDAMVDPVMRLGQGSISCATRWARVWTDHVKLLERLIANSLEQWIDPPLAQTREGVTQLLDGLIAWLRDVAVFSVAGPSGVAHVGYEAALKRQAQLLDVDQCVEATFELVKLRESLDQFVSPRLVATLAREEWLKLWDRRHERLGQGT